MLAEAKTARESPYGLKPPAARWSEKMAVEDRLWVRRVQAVPLGERLRQADILARVDHYAKAGER
jgi:hypothetical protein